MNKKCTIVLPVYNAAQTICRCLDSLSRQTYKDFLVYIIDDGSTDNSYEIVKSYAGKDERYMIFQKENGGAAEARNYVLDKIKTEYVFFLDSDDWIEDCTLEYMIGLAEKYDADLVQSNFKYDYLNKKSYVSKPLFHEEQVIEKCYYNQTIYKKMFRTINLNHIIHTLFRTKIIHGITLNENLRTGEDLYFMIDVFQRANKYVYTQKPLYHYFTRKNSLTNLSTTIGEKIRCNFIISKKITSSLKDWGMAYPQYYILSYFRLVIISCSKIIRILRNNWFSRGVY